MIDLNPFGFSYSFATDVANGQQVGYGDAGALLWHGTAGSVVKLSGGLPNTAAYATNGSIQAGVYIPESEQRAIAWFGSAASRINLHDLLPPGFRASAATAIDADGAIYGYAVDADGQYHVIAWVVPEPSGAIVLCALGLSLLVHRHARVASC
jgi:uncharacterized membrane protein